MRNFLKNYFVLILTLVFCYIHDVKAAEYLPATFKTDATVKENGKQILIRSCAAFLLRGSQDLNIIIYFYSFELSDAQIKMLSTAKYNTLPSVANVQFTVNNDYSELIVFGLGTTSLVVSRNERVGSKDHTTTFKVDKKHVKMKSKGKRLGHFQIGGKEYLQEWDFNIDIPLFHEHF